MQRPVKAKATGASLLAGDQLDPETRNRAMWQRLQKPLYRMLEQQGMDQGHTLNRISVTAGPDYTAGLAGISLADAPVGGFWQFLFRRRRAPFGRRFGLLTLELEGDGAWHCRSVHETGNGSAWSGNAVQSRGMPTFDFHVKASTGTSAVVPERQEPTLPEAKWFVSLDDGTRVELIGICCDQGATWWGPDGSKLESWPGYLGRRGGSSAIVHDLISSRPGRSFKNQLRQPPDPEDDTRCVLLLHVTSYTGFGSSSGASTRGITSLSYGKSSPLLDRFGLSIFPGQYISIKFDPKEQNIVNHGLGLYVLENPQERPGVLSQNGSKGGDMISGGVTGGGTSVGSMGGARGMIPSTRMTRRTDTTDLPLQWIRLENLSLRAGQQTSFEMTLTEKAADLPSTSCAQVLP